MCLGKGAQRASHSSAAQRERSRHFTGAESNKLMQKAQHMNTVQQLTKGAFESQERAACPLQATTYEA
jgi:hypothetical protein